MSHPAEPRVAQVQQELYDIYGCLFVPSDAEESTMWWTVGGVAGLPLASHIRGLEKSGKYGVLNAIKCAALRVAFNAAQATGRAELTEV